MLHAIYSLFTQTHGEPIMAIAPLIMAAIMAAQGALSGREKQKNADQERKYQAEMSRWSPWTGVSTHSVENPSMLNAIAAGGLTGYAQGENFNQAGLVSKILEAKANEAATRAPQSTYDQLTPQQKLSLGVDMDLGRYSTYGGI